MRFTIEQRGAEPLNIEGGEAAEKLAGHAAAAFGSAVSAAQRRPVREVTLALYLGERELGRGTVPELHVQDVLDSVSKALGAALEAAPKRTAGTAAARGGEHEKPE